MKKNRLALSLFSCLMLLSSCGNPAEKTEQTGRTEDNLQTNAITTVIKTEEITVTSETAAETESDSLIDTTTTAVPVIDTTTTTVPLAEVTTSANSRSVFFTFTFDTPAETTVSESSLPVKAPVDYYEYYDPWNNRTNYIPRDGIWTYNKDGKVHYIFCNPDFMDYEFLIFIVPTAAIQMIYFC